MIGVAGSGMSGIAGLLLSLGHRVSGSDKVATVEVARLKGLGLQFNTPHDAGEVNDADLVVYSSAIKAGNVAFDAAVSSGKPMMRRAEALAAIMEGKKGVVVAGMHGKTTTSSMAAHVLRVGGAKPSHYVGAEIPILGTNAHWDAEGQYFIAEGDESDGTIALYHPEHSLLLNVEEEHLDFYSDLVAIEATYAKLLDQTRGSIFYCADDAHASRICAQRGNAISFGEHGDADYRFQTILTKAFHSQFKVFRHGKLLGVFTLNVPGRHNICNATGAIALAIELGVEVAKIAEAFESFRGARRRFEVKYRSDNFMVVDDYGHHPSEIRATLATARGVGQNRVFVMFQPHRYTRTLALKQEFGGAFHDADTVFIANIYPASEKPIEGVSGQMIVDAMIQAGHKGAHYEPDRKQISTHVARLIKPGDLVLSLGAGDIHEQGTVLARDLEKMEELEGVMEQAASTSRAANAGRLIKLHEPLSKHTTMRVGGPAQFWVEPETEISFAKLVKHCCANQIPFMVIGRGSNLLVRDGGIPGVVVHLSRGEFKRLEISDGLITAGVGVKLKELSYAARDAGIGGFEWMEGIPGNVGGALRMNAGAMGWETFQNVAQVNFVNEQGEFHTKSPAELEVNYRSVPSLRRNFAVSAVFKGHPSTRQEIEENLQNSMRKRAGTQPRESSAGCIFKNPPECPAGKLIEELGLKNLGIGGARVSRVHGNFIVNDGHATASDVLALIEEIKKKALQQRGIQLQTEVQIVGEDPHD